MSRDATKGAITYQAETNFGEDVDVTPAWRLPVLDEVDVTGLTWAKQDPRRVVQRRNQITRYIPGPKGGSFHTKLYLTGRGSTSAGAVTIANLPTLLGYVFGTGIVSRAAGMTASAGWSATGGNVSGSGGTLLGSILFYGAKGDGNADGQPAVVATHTGTAQTLLTALPNTGPANTNVVYASDMVYPPESPADAKQTVTGLRFLLQTANLQYLCHGCFARSVRIEGSNPNELLSIDIEWGVSWWEEFAGTFPSAASTDEFNPVPNACGSFFLNTRGTATRVTRDYRTLTIDIKLGLQEEVGPGGVNPYQSIVGVKRLPDEVTISWTEDADAATTSPVLPLQWEANASYHALIGFTNVDGARVAMYFPSLEYVADRPKQTRDGVNRIGGTLRAGTGPTVATELEASAYRFAFA